MNKLSWDLLSTNPTAIHILEANQDKIDWYYLSANTGAIHLLEANQDKIYWYQLSQNPSAIRLLEANQHRVDWCCSQNPSIFEEIKPPIYKQELIEKVFEPRRVMRMGGPEWLDVV